LTSRHASSERATSYPDVTLRSARNRAEEPECDLEFLLRVYASARADEMSRVPWSVEEKEAFLRSQFTLQHEHYHAHYSGARFDVICEGGKDVGRYYVDPTEREIRIMDVALLPESRGHGIGRRLVQDVLDEARASSRSVSLHVEETNPAKRLYERMGFIDVEDRGVYMLMEWRAEVSEPLK
jgi:ribosomal protein S18 acetylase RimI-like enzyme